MKYKTTEERISVLDRELGNIRAKLNDNRAELVLINDVLTSTSGPANDVVKDRESVLNEVQTLEKEFAWKEHEIKQLRQSLVK